MSDRDCSNVASCKNGWYATVFAIAQTHRRHNDINAQWRFSLGHFTYMEFYCYDC